jgi:GNAT superfamily N-acetyltransferase
MRVTFKSHPDPEPDAVGPSPLPEVHAAVSSPDEFILRQAVHEDLHLTARAHVAFLPFGLFPSLGVGFVRRWHRTFLDSPHGAGYVVTDPQAPGNRIVGFLLGTTDQAAHTAAVLADRRTMAVLTLTGAAALLRRPRLARHFARSRAWPWTCRLFRHRPASPAAAPDDTTEPVAVLSAVAVLPDRRGRGIGGRLVAQFLSHARFSGATTAELVTPTALGAAGFYERSGWEAGPDRRTRDGDRVRTYHRALRDIDAR